MDIFAKKIVRLLLETPKGPFKYYVILLGGRGGSPKDHKRSQGGEGGSLKRSRRITRGGGGHGRPPMHYKRAKENLQLS